MSEQLYTTDTPAQRLAGELAMAKDAEVLRAQFSVLDVEAVLARPVPQPNRDDLQRELDRHEHDGNNVCTCGESMGGTSDGAVWEIEANGHLADAVLAYLAALSPTVEGEVDGPAYELFPGTQADLDALTIRPRKTWLDGKGF